MTRVKICGLGTPETVAAAAEAGADWVGLVFVASSPRGVAPEAAADLVAACGEAKPVALLADATDERVAAICRTGISTLQLHGQETPERVETIRQRSGAEVWVARGIAGPGDLEDLPAYGAADRWLLDARPPDGAGQRGGHGRAFDWAILEGWQPARPWILAGGLDPETVGEAIRRTGAPAVDVSSGVERAAGLKDLSKVRAFIAAAKAA